MVHIDVAVHSCNFVVSGRSCSLLTLRVVDRRRHYRNGNIYVKAQFVLVCHCPRVFFLESFSGSRFSGFSVGIFGGLFWVSKDFFRVFLGIFFGGVFGVFCSGFFGGFFGYFLF